MELIAVGVRQIPINAGTNFPLIKRATVGLISALVRLLLLLALESVSPGSVINRLRTPMEIFVFMLISNEI